MKENDNNSSKPSGDNLGVWNDPELEARLVAMLMGELSPFEEAEMEQELERSPELRLFRDRMLEVQSLITDVNKQDKQTEYQEDWSLSSERRSSLLENFNEDKPERLEVKVKLATSSTSSIQWKNVFSIAACLLISLAAFLMMFLRKGATFHNTEELVSYSASSESKEAIEIGGGTSIVLAANENRKSDRVGKRESGLMVEEKSTTSKYYAYDLDKITNKPEVSNEVARKPSIPSSSMAKAITSNTPNPTAVPVPGNVVKEPSLDFGDGDDFGNGWGNGRGAGSAGAEGKRKQLAKIDLAKSARQDLGRDPFGEEDLEGNTNYTGRGDIRGVNGLKDSDRYAEEKQTNINDGKSSLDSGRNVILSKIKDARMPLDDVTANSLGVNPQFSSSFLSGDLIEDGDKSKNSYAWWVGDASVKSDLQMKGNRSGDYAISRDNIDPFLNKTNKRKSGSAKQNLVQAEVARRELQVAESHKALLDGRKAYSDRSYEEAVDKYKSALALLPQGPIAEDRRREYTAHLLDGSIALSQQYRRVGKYDEASGLLENVLKQDPGNVVAKKHLEYLDDPIRTSPTLTYEHVKDVENVRKLLYRAHSYYDQAQFDHATLEFKEVLRKDPYNKAARRGIEKVEAAKSDYYRAAYDQTRAAMLSQVDSAWEIEVPPSVEERKLLTENAKISELGDKSLYSKKNPRLVVRDKLENIQLPLVEFDEEATVRDAVNFLRQRARELDSNELDSNKKGLSFVFRNPTIVDAADGLADTGVGIDEAEKIENIKLGALKLKNVPMDEALRQIAQLTGLRYKVDGGVVTLLKATDVDDNEMYARTFRVPEKLLGVIRDETENSMDGSGPFASEVVTSKSASLKDVLEMQGIKFPEGSTVGYSKERGTLTVRNTANGLDQVEELVRYTAKKYNPAHIDRGLNNNKHQDFRWRKSNALSVGQIDSKSDQLFTQKEVDERRLDAIETFKKKRILQEEKVENHRTRLYALSKKLQIPYHGKDARHYAGRDSDANEHDRADQAYEEAKRTKDQLESFVNSLSGLNDEDLKITLLASQRPEAAVLATGYNQLSAYKKNKELALANGLADNHKTIKSLDESIKQIEERLDRSTIDVRKKIAADLVVLNQNVEKLRIDTNAEAGELMVAAEEKTKFGKVREDYERELAILDAIKQAEFSEKLLVDMEKEVVLKKTTPDFSKEISAEAQTHSTFSLNVSDVSYKLAKSVLLEKGGMPEPAKIRVEEFVNAFDYGDPSACGKKVNCVVEQCAHPFYQQRNLMRIGMKTGAMGRSQPLRLTVLLDNSGSMEREDRAATVVKAVAALASLLGPQDEITLLSFARDARLVAQKVKGDQAHKLVNIVKTIPSEGGTNLSLAIEQAYTTAKQSLQEGTMSRIVLITDGAANLGNADPEDLSKSIERMRQNGIAFDACGVGADGLDDDMLEALTRKGDGRYYFINKPEDADADFAQKLAGALRPAAKNVKVQVVFNPERVGNYRLVGFEKHRLKKEDFRNDSVDAAEMAAEEAGNALYQVEARPDGKGDVGTVFVRFRDMATGQMVERSWAIPYEPSIKNLTSAAPSMQLATVAGMLGERLKLGEEAGIDLKQIKPIFGKLRSHFHTDQEVKDLIRMCEKVR